MEFGSAIVPYGTHEKQYFKKRLFLLVCLLVCFFVCWLTCQKKPIVELSTKILISISVKLTTLIFLLPANSLSKRNFFNGNFTSYILGIGKLLSFSRSRAIYKESNRFQFLSLLQQQLAARKQHFSLPGKLIDDGGLLVCLRFSSLSSLERKNRLVNRWT